jgi:O-antigen/teichoic acid export membrane protein
MTLDGLAVRRECWKHEVRLRLDRDCRTEWRVLLHFALPALAANVLVMPVLWLGRVILVRSEFGFPALGVVDVVDTLRTLAMYLPTVLLAPTFAILSNVSSDAASVRKTLRYAIGMAALLVFPTAIVITSLAKYVLQALYGTEFAQEGMTLAFAMAVVAIQATGTPLGNYLSAMGKMWLCLLINLLWACAFLGLSLVLVPKYGQAGYMGSMALAYLINMILVYGGFYLRLPQLMKAYPLVWALTLFGLLLPVAIYVNAHFNVVAAFGAAAVLGGGLAIALAAPLAKGNLHRAPASSVANVTGDISRSDD